MRKIFLPILVFLLLFSQAAYATEGPQLACKSALLLDGRSGEVLYEQDPDVQAYPASVTKLMTLTLILEAVDSGVIALDDVVTVSADAAGMGGSQVYLYEGEQRTVDEMLIAIAVGSGNDASYAMAEYLGGTMENFVEMMNERAAELGMTGTHFVNPHGLHDPEHYTTANDLGKLACYSLTVPHMLEYTGIYEYEFRPEPKQLILWNTNRLLKWYEGTDGLKTGYTPEAGRNLVATAERNGLRLISIVLGCTERQGHFSESMDLLNYGFNSYIYTPLYAAGEVIAEAPVSKGRADSVKLIAATDVGYISLKTEQAEIRVEVALTGTLKAPVTEGDVGGTLVIYKNGAPWHTVDLVTESGVTKGGPLRTWSKLLKEVF